MSLNLRYELQEGYAEASSTNRTVEPDKQWPDEVYDDFHMQQSISISIGNARRDLRVLLNSSGNDPKVYLGSLKRDIKIDAAKQDVHVSEWQPDRMMYLHLCSIGWNLLRSWPLETGFKQVQDFLVEFERFADSYAVPCEQSQDG